MKSENNLSPEEINNLVELLKKVRLPAPYPVFLALYKSVTMAVVNLAIMPNKKSILLTRRKDEFFDNWHLPGSILLTGESPEETAKRVARKELGIAITDLRFAHYFHDNTVRGSEVDLLFIAKPKGEPNNGQYFGLDEIPKDLIEFQNKQIKYLKYGNSI